MSDDVKACLEEWVEGGESMEGFVLRYAHLEGIAKPWPQCRRSREPS